MLSVIIVFLCVLLGILIYFKQSTKRISAVHKDRLSSLNQAILKEQGQVSYRQLMLNNYDFTTYNLRDALVVQQEIKI